MPSGSIDIKLSVEEREALRALSALIRKTDQVGDEFKETGREADQMRNRIRNAFPQREALNFTAAMGRLVGVIGSVGAAWGAVNRIILPTVEAFAEQEAVERRLEAVLKATNYQVGLSAQQLKNYANELSRVTRYGDEVTLSAMSMLATFDKIRGDQFLRTIRVAQDMASTFDRDLRGSVMQVAKALQEPTVGLSALRETGISFTAEQQKVIKAFAETNQLARAQVEILEVLEAQLGGVAEAEGKTALGHLERMKNATGDFKEAVGGLTVEVGGFNAAMADMTLVLNTFTAGLGANTDALSENRTVWGRWRNFMVDVEKFFTFGPGNDTSRLIKWGDWDFTFPEGNVVDEMNDVRDTINRELDDTFFGDKFREMVGGISGAIESVDFGKAFDDGANALEGFVDKLNEGLEYVKEMNEHFDSLKRFSASLHESLKTPRERIREEFAKIEESMRLGLLNERDFRRWMKQQRDEFKTESPFQASFVGLQDLNRQIQAAAASDNPLLSESRKQTRENEKTNILLDKIERKVGGPARAG